MTNELPLSNADFEPAYRTLLKRRYDQSRQSNRSFSIRAFASKLDVSHTLVSSVFLGKKSISSEIAGKIVDRLNLTALERQVFLLSVELEQAQTTELKKLVQQKLEALKKEFPKREVLTPEQFTRFCQLDTIMVYVAIGMTAWNGTLASLAQIVGESEPSTLSTLQVLSDMNLVSHNQAGRWVRTAVRPVLSSDVTSAPLRDLHRAFIQKAVESLETQSPQEKYVASETICLDEAAYKKICEILDETMDRVNVESYSSVRSDRIYHLNVQFFKLGNIAKP